MRDGRCARVEILDDGPGIPKEIQNRVFEPFFTTKPVGDGTGLGLETVQRIIRNHGGDVRFTSQPGETRFVVRVPFSGSSVDA
jgi:signal transduction histidine kinase